MLIIRKAKLKDVSVIVKLWKDFMKYHDDIIIKENPEIKPHLIKKKNAVNVFKKFIQKNIRSKNAVVFIAEVNGKHAGYSLNFIKDNNPIFKLEKIGHVSDLFVKKEFRGMKISSKFKNEAKKWFKKKGIKHMEIVVYKDNKYAHSIYERWGFFDHKIEMRKNI